MIYAYAHVQSIVCTAQHLKDCVCVCVSCVGEGMEKCRVGSFPFIKIKRAHAIEIGRLIAVQDLSAWHGIGGHARIHTHTPIFFNIIPFIIGSIRVWLISLEWINKMLQSAKCMSIYTDGAHTLSHIHTQKTIFKYAQAICPPLNFDFHSWPLTIRKSMMVKCV